MNRFFFLPVLLLLSFQSYSQWTQVGTITDCRVIIENDSVILLSSTGTAFTTTSLSGPWTTVDFDGVAYYAEAGDSVYIVQNSWFCKRSQFSDFSTSTLLGGGGNIGFKDTLLYRAESLAGWMFSPDETQNWYESNSGLPPVIGGAGGPYFYADDATHSDQYFFVSSFSKVYRRSAVFGQWEEKANGLPGADLLECIDDILYTNDGASLYASSDFGENWSFLYTAPSTIKVIEKYGNMLLLGTKQSGVHASIDNGSTWESMTYGLGLALEIYDIAVYKDTILCTNDNGLWMLPASILDLELSISESSDMDHFVQVYPNPSKGSFIVQFPNQSGEGVEITIADLSGRAFYNSVQTSSSVEINELMEAGMYIVNVSGTGYSSTVKVLVE